MQFSNQWDQIITLITEGKIAYALKQVNGLLEREDIPASTKKDFYLISANYKEWDQARGLGLEDPFTKEGTRIKKSLIDFVCQLKDISANKEVKGIDIEPVKKKPLALVIKNKQIVRYGRIGLILGGILWGILCWNNKEVLTQAIDKQEGSVVDEQSKNDSTNNLLRPPKPVSDDQKRKQCEVRIIVQDSTQTLIEQAEISIDSYSGYSDSSGFIVIRVPREEYANKGQVLIKGRKNNLHGRTYNRICEGNLIYMKLLTQ